MRASTTYETQTPSRGTASDPSAWSARLPIAALTLAGLCIASYLAAFQLGVFSAVWEPFFGDGSRQVLHSFISRMLPVPDAALGAAGYLAELVAGLIGGSDRCRTMPWLVALYGALVALVSVTAIGLACVQLFIIHHACTLCLTSAAISIVIAWLARHEVFASLALLKERRDKEH